MSTKPSSFANADIDDIVAKLTSEEAISLTAGVGFWHTAAIPRLGVPAIKVSDGPNGIRGNHFFMATPAKTLPSATALGATFDPELVYQVASKLLAPEAKLRAVSIVLGPTANIQRSPLGGRSFESFSEDPTVSGHIAAAYIKGLQDEGVGACMKHFTANDQEDDRQGLSSNLTQRALREIYLVPFMIAEKYSKPWAYMTSYGRINGLHCSENPWLLKKLLRDEWKSDALTMSDWFGIYSVTESVNAGLDLEMPGVNKWRASWQMNWSLNSRKLTLNTIKARARSVLQLVKKAAAGAPDVLDGDGIERTVDKEEDKELMRKLASQSIVLLKNKDDILPLSKESLKKVAIVGGNAKAFILSGGGSAALKPSYFVSPYQGIVNALGENVEVSYTEGAQTFMTLPSLDWDLVTESGAKGWDGEWYSHDENDKPLDKPVATRQIDETYIFISNSAPAELTERWTLKLKSKIRPREEDTLFEFGVTVAGRAKLYVDGQLLVDNWTRQRRGKSFFNTGTEEEKGRFLLKKGVAHDILVEFGNVRGPADGDEDETTIGGGPGVRIGGCAVIDPEEEIQKAVNLAKEADIAIVVVGLNGDWETEGYDRRTIKLPGKTDELVKRVAAANPKTIVVTQAGSAIELPWTDDIAGLVHTWYLGNATGDAIADVLFGHVNPSAKLSLTFPKRLEDNPSFGHFGTEDGHVWYAEDLFVGYKHYVSKLVEPLYPFGFGLSYTTFEFSDLTVTQPEGNEFEFTASVKVTNTGKVEGSEIVQIYVTPGSNTQLTHPKYALRGFGKARNVAPGTSVTVKVKLDKQALSYWDVVEEKWKIEAGKYGVFLGADSGDIRLRSEVEVKKESYWVGL